MSREQLKKDILEAKRWGELVERVTNMVDRYGAPTLRQMAEVFDCGIDILHNIGDTEEGLQVVGDPSDPNTLRVTRRAVNQN